MIVVGTVETEGLLHYTVFTLGNLVVTLASTSVIMDWAAATVFLVGLPQFVTQSSGGHKSLQETYIGATGLQDESYWMRVTLPSFLSGAHNTAGIVVL